MTAEILEHPPEIIRDNDLNSLMTSVAYTLEMVRLNVSLPHPAFELLVSKAELLRFLF